MRETEHNSNLKEMSPQIENEDLTPSSVSQLSSEVEILRYEASWRLEINKNIFVLSRTLLLRTFLLNGS